MSPGGTWINVLYLRKVVFDMADVKNFEFDFSDLEKPVNDLGDGGNAFAGSDDIRYSENKNMNVSNQSGKKSFTFR